VTARRSDIGGAGSAIAVELSMDDAELAERVRMMITESPDIEIVEAEHGRMPQVRITYGAVEFAPNVPVLVLTDASGVMEALQAGASAVLSECADGDTLSTAIRAAAQGLLTLSAEIS
jgi:DNA-binding NarL/FixJ family response regulator